MKPKNFVPLVALHLKISLTRVQLQKTFPPLQREVIDRTAKSSYLLDTSLHDFFASSEKKKTEKKAVINESKTFRALSCLAF